jgi:transcriptional regulator with PAS, ATPase and Fis domain
MSATTNKSSGVESNALHASGPVIVGVSQAIRSVLQLVDQVAATDCCVLIEGESGTGKELIARRIFARSRRHEHPFIPVNCAGISETLFESQFFGHVRGAFTGAEQTMLGVIRTADGGTVFLDEICDFPMGLQPKLLRVLQEQEVMPVGKPVPVKVDCRFMAGSNRNLAEMVRQGTFRRDLYHRLNIVRVVLPALRERPEDISPLLDHFLRIAAKKYTRDIVFVSSQVRGLLTGYPWPGNIRELSAWVERLYVTGLEPESLVEMLFGESASSTSPSINLGNPADPQSLRQIERQAIVNAMEQSNFNQRKAARMLQVHRATLARKLKSHKLD